jgi:hypothetical protein
MEFLKIKNISLSFFLILNLNNYLFNLLNNLWRVVTLESTSIDNKSSFKKDIGRVFGMYLVHECHLDNFWSFKENGFFLFINGNSVNKFIIVRGAFISECKYSFFFRNFNMIFITLCFKVIKKDFNIFFKGFDFNKVIFNSNFSGFWKKYFGSWKLWAGRIRCWRKKTGFSWFWLNL